MFCIDIEWVIKARKWRCSVTFGGCEYILVLNNDMKLGPNCIRALLGFNSVWQIGFWILFTNDLTFLLDTFTSYGPLDH